MELEIVPEPDDGERAAIELALASLDTPPRPGRWRLAALAEGVEPSDGEERRPETAG